MHDGKHIIEDARRIGIQGYVSKSEASATLLAAVDALLRNQTFFPEGT
jgi:DNA-binding NarL/FixJ family response regulator